MEQLKQTKVKYRKFVDELITNGVVKNHSDLAKQIGYAKGSISQMLNPESDKNISELFIMKLHKMYPDSKPIKVKDNSLLELQASQNVIFETLAQLISQQTGRNISLIISELKQAVELKMQE